MKKLFQKYSSAFFSLISTARSLQNPLFIALVSYAFIKNSNQQELTQINQVLILLNLISVFTGWGIKNYLVREQIANSGIFNQIWNRALLAKLPLVLIVFMFCLPIYSSGNWIVIIALIAIRTFNLHFEPLLLLSNKNVWVLSIEWFFYVLIFLSVYLGTIVESKHFLFLLTLSEFFKSLLLFAMFKNQFAKTDLKTASYLLWETRSFFIASLAGFFQSKADLYVLSLLLKDTSLNQYQIITGMMFLGSLSVASFTALYSKLFFKNLNNSGQKFFHINFYTGLFAATLFTLSINFLLPRFYDYSVSLIQNALFFINIVLFSLVLTEMYHYTKLDKVNASTLLIFLSGIVNLSCSFFLVKQFAVSGALLSNTISTMVLFLLLLVVRKRMIEQTSPMPYN